MSRTLQSLVSIVIIAGVGLPLWHFVVARRSDPRPAPPREVGPSSVRAQRVARLDIPLEVDVYGTLVPLRAALLAPEQPGRVTWVRPAWRPGARVSAGDELLRLDDTVFALEVERAIAAREEALARLSAAQRDSALTKELRSGAAQSLELARREDERLQELLQRARISESQADQARSAVVRAEQELQSADAREQTSVVLESAARALAAQADAAVRIAEEALGRTRLVAPFDGRLAGRAPALGSYLHIGAPVVECLDLSELHLVAMVHEDQLAFLREGLEAEVSFPSRPGVSLTGRVRALGPRADVTTRSAAVEIAIPNPSEVALAHDERAASPSSSNGAERAHELLAPLFAGTFARARIRAGVREDVVWVDRRHIDWRGDRPYCFVLEDRADGGHVVRERELGLAEALGEGFEVTAGLAEGERLVTGPLDRLRDGVRVTLDDGAGSAAR